MSRSRSLLALAALTALTGCTDPQKRPQAVQSPLVRPPMMETRPATYDCDNSGRVFVRPVGEDGRAITLAFKSRDIALKRVDAAEGQKFSDGTTVFWMNGDAANLQVAAGKQPESCERPE